MGVSRASRGHLHAGDELAHVAQHGRRLLLLGLERALDKVRQTATERAAVCNTSIDSLILGDSVAESRGSGQTWMAGRCVAAQLQDERLEGAAGPGTAGRAQRQQPRRGQQRVHLVLEAARPLQHLCGRRHNISSMAVTAFLIRIKQPHSAAYFRSPQLGGST